LERAVQFESRHQRSRTESLGLIPLRHTRLAVRFLFAWLQNPVALRAALQATCTAARSGTQSGTRQLLIDVSVLARVDAGTGIQRVTKALLEELAGGPPDGYSIRRVCASRWRNYRYVGGPDASARVEIRPGDVFLGLDLSSRIIPRHRLQLFAWQVAGARLCFVVYDLLPHLHPRWFTRKNSQAFAAWMRTVAIHADSVCCISQSVATQFQHWLLENGFSQQCSPYIASFRLGTQPPSEHSTSVQNARIQRVCRHPFVLIVGTLEPRKGHSLALDAFDALWRDGHPMQLVLVGRVGWKVDALVSRLRRHTEVGRRLHWFDSADDATLHALYAAALGVLVVSEGEGCGLPILEAATHGKPLLLRDLPVFREIAAESATYFSANTPLQFLAELRDWLTSLERGSAIPPKGITLQGWGQSALQLLTCALKWNSTPSQTTSLHP
jgi:glycosyltransferase involved in cell wall biosynthesis